MAVTTADELASRISNLVSFPDVAIRIEQKLADENSSVNDIAEVIRVDPAVSAALLRLANSAIYGAGGEVSSISRAVMVVGLRELRDLAYGICTTRAFEGVTNEIVSVEDFWRHSLHCAVAAKIIGASSRIRCADSPFTAGLLHDIGHLVMFNQEAESSRKALEMSLDLYDGTNDYLAEQQVFAFDHAAVGASLAEKWGLPEGLIKAIRYHHQPLEAGDDAGIAMIVHVANAVAVLAELDSMDFEEAPTNRRSCVRHARP